MSQIGKKPIDLPDNVKIDLQDTQISVSKDNKQLFCKIHPEVKIIVEDSIVRLDRINDEKKSKEMHGLLRSLIQNMVIGVTDGFQKELNLVGVGYTVENKGNFLLLNFTIFLPSCVIVLLFQSSSQINYPPENLFYKFLKLSFLLR